MSAVISISTGKAYGVSQVLPGLGAEPRQCVPGFATGID